MNIEFFGATNVGRVRELNEDSYSIFGFDGAQPPGICILADGMGGHNAGEVASQNAVTFVHEILNDSFAVDQSEIPGLLTEAAAYANDEIYKLSISDNDRQGMGTTLVISYIVDGTAYIANIGDSRAYAIRDDVICRITVDHSIVEELVAEGSITHEEAMHHPQRNIITRAVGTNPSVKSDIFEYTYMPGDVMLMCSDGLCGLLTDDEILQIVKGGESMESITNNLIEAALNAGGHDNVTVIGLRFTE